MQNLSKFTKNIRSKNAGPFWITIDIFFKNKKNYETVSTKLNNDEISSIFKINSSKLKRFDIKNLNVIKISFPRQNIQGSRLDRDIHGASFAVLLEDLKIL